MMEQEQEDVVERYPKLCPSESGILYNRSFNTKDPIHFKLDLQVDNIDEFRSIMQMVLDKISCLRDGHALESCILKLYAIPPFGKEKAANLTISMGGKQKITECKSSRWDNAFLNAFDKLCHNNEDYH